MKPPELMDQILPVLHSVKDDAVKLQKILDFLLGEIYEEPDDILQVPEKYRKVVHDIAENIDCGLVCYYTAVVNQSWLKDSQSHHAGIEMQRNRRPVFTLHSPNRTMQELKSHSGL